MQVIISVCGKFWAFELAKQLLKRNYLKKLITSYPKFLVINDGIPKNKISSVSFIEFANQGWQKITAFMKIRFDLNYVISELFDKIASKKLEKSDIFVGWSSKSLNTLRKARKNDMKTIIECGSTHPFYQQKILKEEYKKFGLRYKGIHQKLIKKMLKEFEESDYIVVPSKFVEKTFIKENIPKEKLIHVPYGVNLNLFKQIEKKDDVFRIIFIGGLGLRKGVHYLLKAFSELKIPKLTLPKAIPSSIYLSSSGISVPLFSSLN